MILFSDYKYTTLLRTMFFVGTKNIVSAKFEAIKVRAETAETAGTTESIFDTQFRCRLFRLCRLSRLSFSKKQRFLTFTNY